jgi:uroporphyrinogen-III synthase
MKRLIVLRPEPGASETVRRARELGLDAIAIPLFEIEPVPWTPPDPSAFDALLLTSANAVRHAGEGLELLTTLQVHAVGQATADAARNAGFAIAAVGDGGVDDLLSVIDPETRLLHLSGEDRRDPTVARKITSIPVYRSIALAAPAGLEQAEHAVVLIHSARAGLRFQKLAQQLRLDRRLIAIAAISKSSALAAGDSWSAIEVAERPSDDALLALALRLCDKPEST